MSERYRESVLLFIILHSAFIISPGPSPVSPGAARKGATDYRLTRSCERSVGESTALGCGGVSAKNQTSLAASTRATQGVELPCPASGQAAMRDDDEARGQNEEKKLGEFSVFCFRLKVRFQFKERGSSGPRFLQPSLRLCRRLGSAVVAHHPPFTCGCHAHGSAWACWLNVRHHVSRPPLPSTEPSNDV